MTGVRRVASCVVVGLLLAPAGAVAADVVVRVVAHPQVKGNQVPREVLAAIFLKQAVRWGDGSPVLPVDQSVQSEARKSFSRAVLRKPMIEIQVYWQQRMARGLTPPTVKGSDKEVLAYVATTAGAIGYVAEGTPIPSDVKVIEVAH